MLLGEVLGVDRPRLLLDRGVTPSPAAVERFAALVERRAARVPLQHLVGRWPFLELELRVDRRALVPRPETEDLALLSRRRMSEGPAGIVVDVGTGSGCLAVALAVAGAGCVLAIDSSAPALALARENVELTGTGARVALVRGDLLEPVRETSAALLVANLPYVRTGELAGLEPEVRDHDPREALDGGADGLGPILRLLAVAPARVVAGGSMLLEMAPEQTAPVAARLRSEGWAGVEVRLDRYGRERFVEARR